MKGNGERGTVRGLFPRRLARVKDINGTACVFVWRVAHETHRGFPPTGGVYGSGASYVYHHVGAGIGGNGGERGLRTGAERSGRIDAPRVGPGSEAGTGGNGGERGLRTGAEVFPMERARHMEDEERMVRRAGNAVKWGFVFLLAALAGTVAFLQLFRTPPAQRPLQEAVRRLEEGDIEGAMSFVDPQGQLGILWAQNVEGVRDRLLEVFGRYRLEFSSLRWRTRTEGDFAEASPAKGRVTIYPKEGGGPPLAVYDLGGADLVFYLQKKDGSWWIEGVNLDLEELLRGDFVFP